MEMKLNSSLVRAEREKRAWSQEHLAKVSGLGLRTVQRIESTGSASYDSATAIAAIFSIPVAELRLAEPKVRIPVTAPVRAAPSFRRRASVLIGACVVATVLSPPTLVVQIPLTLAIWLSYEFGVRAAS